MEKDNGLTAQATGLSLIAQERDVVKFFEFDQNNSGGSFDIDDERGIGARVYIEAIDANHANARAEQIGLYFDGVDDGRDCGCCGDRWCRAWDKGEARLHIDKEYAFNWHSTVYVHRLNGDIERWTLAKFEDEPRGLSASEAPTSAEAVTPTPSEDIP